MQQQTTGGEQDSGKPGQRDKFRDALNSIFYNLCAAIDPVAATDRAWGAVSSAPEAQKYPVLLDQLRQWRDSVRGAVKQSFTDQLNLALAYQGRVSEVDPIDWTKSHVLDALTASIGPIPKDPVTPQPDDLSCVELFIHRAGSDARKSDPLVGSMVYGAQSLSNRSTQALIHREKVKLAQAIHAALFDACSHGAITVAMSGSTAKPARSQESSDVTDGSEKAEAQERGQATVPLSARYGELRNLIREYLSVHPDGTPKRGFIEWAAQERKPVPEDYKTGSGTWYAAWKDDALRHGLETTFYREKRCLPPVIPAGQ